MIYSLCQKFVNIKCEMVVLYTLVWWFTKTELTIFPFEAICCWVKCNSFLCICGAQMCKSSQKFSVCMKCVIKFFLSGLYRNIESIGFDSELFVALQFFECACFRLNHCQVLVVFLFFCWFWNHEITRKTLVSWIFGFALCV